MAMTIADSNKHTHYSSNRKNCLEARKQVQPSYVTAVIVGAYQQISLLLLLSFNTIRLSRH